MSYLRLYPINPGMLLRRCIVNDPGRHTVLTEDDELRLSHSSALEFYSVHGMLQTELLLSLPQQKWCHMSAKTGRTKPGSTV